MRMSWKAASESYNRWSLDSLMKGIVILSGGFPPRFSKPSKKVAKSSERPNCSQLVVFSKIIIACSIPLEIHQICATIYWKKNWKIGKIMLNLRMSPSQNSKIPKKTWKTWFQLKIEGRWLIRLTSNLYILPKQNKRINSSKRRFLNTSNLTLDLL